ncbi:CDP-alcohol phosphatidyltransferase family protein [Angustibacter luteus]|uniref:CDP-alcohol phosphatidyltransferase family protein n=1 Tax=Angustibacter luteus TaxID=658456 RepID=A0ABW1JAK9_9ACTN
MPPDVLTGVGLLVACAVVPIAALGGRWPVLGAVVLVASGLLDNLDGAVAVLSGRVTRWGALLDAVADRVADGAACLALWAVGGWAGLALGAGVLGYLHEYARARATAVGMPDAGAITVAERPTRLIVVVMFLLGAGIYPDSAAAWGTAGAACLLAVGAVGFGQLMLVVGRTLR